MYYVGIDIGTSSLKLTLIDQCKEIVYESSHAYHYEEPQHGYREMNPVLWLDSAQKALRELYELNFTQDIEVIGITGQMHSTVFLDAMGNCVRPAILWNDVRSASLISALKSEMIGMEETKYITRILSTGSPFTNLLWVKENEENNFKRIKKVTTSYGYLVYKLTGRLSCDYCEASTSSMYDIASKQWSQYMLKRIDIDESYFGELHASCDIVGNVTEELCQLLGMKKTVKVIAGTGDNPATAVAMGVLNSSEPVISLGTSGVIILPKKDGDFEGRGKNVIFKTNSEEFINVEQGVVQSAGGTHKWWVEDIMESNDLSIDQNKISLQDLGNNSLLFYPHIAGEKTIHHDPTLRGAFFGLDTRTKRKDMTQAILEGVAFGFKEVLENMDLQTWPKKVRMNGGGSKSEIWMQLLADVLGVEIVVSTFPATPSYGVCLLAMLADKQDMRIQQIEQTTCYFPREDIHLRYNKGFEKYKKIYQLLKILDE